MFTRTTWKTCKKLKPKFKLNDLFISADNGNLYFKGVSTNESYEIFSLSKVVHDTFPRCQINYLPERSMESLLKSTSLRMEQNREVMKNKI